MKRAYKYRLNPTPEQIVFFNKSFGCCRFVYNYMLGKRIEAYQRDKTKIGWVELAKMLTELKKEDGKEWLSEVSNECLQQSIRNMDSAFVKFFREKAGFPNFKAKHYSRQSYKAINSVSVDLDNNKVRLPKIGWVKFFPNRKFDGKVCSATVSKTPTGKYFISVLVDDGKEIPVKPAVRYDTSIGIDVGIKDFAVCSNGDVYANPKYLEKSEARLKVLQRRFSKTKKGSNRRERARKILARQYEKVFNQRNNFLHQVTSKIVRENQTIIIEDLNVKGMLKNHRLAKSISSVSWSEFFRQLEYKCEWYGRNLIRIGRFEASSKTCICGYVNSELKLSDREWVCPKCGRHNDRDILASVNIKRFGLISPLVEGVEDVEWSAVAGAVKRQYVCV